MYYWYYGTYALFQTGGKAWKSWNTAFKSAVLAMQSKSGGRKGSWDPIGPWGYAGGRVYATAILSLGLEVYYRYPRFAETKPSAWRERLVASIGSVPVIVVDASEFIGSTEVRVAPRSGDAEIRYTLDGSDPTIESPRAKGAIVVKETALVRAAGFIGDERIEPVVARRLTRVEPIASVAPPRSRKSRDNIRVELFELHAPGLPKFDDLKLEETFMQDRFDAPLKARKPNCAVRFSGYLYFPKTAMYEFKVGVSSAAQLHVGGKRVLERIDDLANYTLLEGHVALAKGWHPFELGWTNQRGGNRLSVVAGAAAEEPIAFESDRMAYE